MIQWRTRQRTEGAVLDFLGVVFLLAVRHEDPDARRDQRDVHVLAPVVLLLVHEDTHDHHYKRGMRTDSDAPNTHQG